eukprot:jgi/Mesvir1/10022/Mv03644-RA.2
MNSYVALDDRRKKAGIPEAKAHMKDAGSYIAYLEREVKQATAHQELAVRIDKVANCLDDKIQAVSRLVKVTQEYAEKQEDNVLRALASINQRVAALETRERAEQLNQLFGLVEEQKNESQRIVECIHLFETIQAAYKGEQAAVSTEVEAVKKAVASLEAHTQGEGRATSSQVAVLSEQMASLQAALASQAESVSALKASTSTAIDNATSTLQREVETRLATWQHQDGRALADLAAKHEALAGEVRERGARHEASVASARDKIEAVRQELGLRVDGAQRDAVAAISDKLAHARLEEREVRRVEMEPLLARLDELRLTTDATRRELAAVTAAQSALQAGVGALEREMPYLMNAQGRMETALKDEVRVRVKKAMDEVFDAVLKEAQAHAEGQAGEVRSSLAEQLESMVAAHAQAQAAEAEASRNMDKAAEARLQSQLDQTTRVLDTISRKMEWLQDEFDKVQLQTGQTLVALSSFVAEREAAALHDGGKAGPSSQPPRGAGPLGPRGGASAGPRPLQRSDTPQETLDQLVGAFWSGKDTAPAERGDPAPASAAAAAAAAAAATAWARVNTGTPGHTREPSLSGPAGLFGPQEGGGEGAGASSADEAMRVLRTLNGSPSPPKRGGLHAPRSPRKPHGHHHVVVPEQGVGSVLAQKTAKRRNRLKELYQELAALEANGCNS